MSTVMKRLVPVLAMLFLVSFFAGAESRTADTYVKVVYIEKIAPHSLGYKVDYRTSSGYIVTTYIPIKWFGTTSGKGEIVDDISKASPYMEIVFTKGKFSLVRLHVWPNYNHESWTALSNGVDWTDKFNIEEPTFKF